jgi:hypothetical protein
LDNSLVRRQIVDVVDRGIKGAYMQTAAANRELAPLQTIGRTPNAQGTPIQDVRVNHRRADIRMAEQFLNRSNIVAVLEQMRRKGVAERVAADPFRNPSPADRGRDRALHDRFVQMISGRWSESQVSANSRRGKHELPAPVGCRIGILPFECRRKSHAAETIGQIPMMLAPHVSEMRRQARLQARGEHRSAILLSLPTPDYDLIAVEIEVFDASSRDS